MVENILFFIIETFQERYRKIAEKKIAKYNSGSKLQYVFPSTIDVAQNYYPSDIFEKLILINFEGKKFYVYKDYDKCLGIEYGDYMQLPPKDKKVWKHIPQLINFHKNYEDIKGN